MTYDKEWKQVWHEKIVPKLPIKGLVALRDAMRGNWPELGQGYTCQANEAGGIKCACLIAYPLWKAGNLSTVEQVYNWFTLLCNEVDCTGYEWSRVTNRFDYLSRANMLAEFLPEVEMALKDRGWTAEEEQEPDTKGITQ